MKYFIQSNLFAAFQQSKRASIVNASLLVICLFIVTLLWSHRSSLHNRPKLNTILGGIEFGLKSNKNITKRNGSSDISHFARNLEVQGLSTLNDPIQVTSSGTFVTFLPPEAKTDGIGTKIFTWGDPGEGSYASSFELKEPTSHIANTDGSIFSFGTLVFKNGETVFGTEATSVTLKIIVTFGNETLNPIEVPLEITTTLNTPGNPTDARSADIVRLPSTINKQDVNSISKKFEFIGFGQNKDNPNTEGCNNLDGFIITFDRFHVTEGKCAIAELLGRFIDPGSLEDKPQDNPRSIKIPNVPNTSNGIWYASTPSNNTDNGKFPFALTLTNPSSNGHAKFAVCVLVDAETGTGEVKQWKLFNSSMDGWTCKADQDATGQIKNSPNLRPDYHFGCREFDIPPGETDYWFDDGGEIVPNTANVALNPVSISFLEALPPKVDSTCQSIAAPGVANLRGTNRRLTPEQPIISANLKNYVNYRTKIERFQASQVLVDTQSVKGSTGIVKGNQNTLFGRSCTIEWPSGSEFTDANPNTYPVQMIGKITDAPAGSVITFRFPPGSPQLERTYTVSSTLSNPSSCTGNPVDINDPFVISPEWSTVGMDIKIPTGCSSLSEGSLTRFLGQVVGGPNIPIFQPGAFVVGYSGTCVVDDTPPQVSQVAAIPRLDGTIDIYATVEDKISMPLEALLRFKVNGGQEESIWMNFDEPPVKGRFVFFRQTIGPFSYNSTVDLSLESFDDVGNSSVSSLKTQQVEVAANLVLTKTVALNPAIVGQNITYTLVVTNDGPGLATSVSLTDTLPTTVTFKSATSTQGNCVAVNTNLICNLGDLSNGASARVVLTVNTTTAGDLINKATVTSTAIELDAQNNTVSIKSTVVPPVFYMSFSSSGKVDNIAFEDKDIVAYSTGSNIWSMVFDGSDVGITTDLDGFAFLSDGSVLLTFQEPINIPRLGEVDDSDIIKFVPSSLGDTADGYFEWYFDGFDVDLTTEGEDIDAITFATDGRLVISTKGDVKVPGVSASDEDLLVFDATSFGEDTNGTWELYFDGSDPNHLTKVGEDIWDAWIDKTSGKLFLSLNTHLTTDAHNDEGTDIYVCIPDSPRIPINCTLHPFWVGSTHGLSDKRIDGFAIGDALLTRLDVSNGNDNDHKDQNNRLYLPIISR